MVNFVIVSYLGTDIGVISYDDNANVFPFQFTKEYLDLNIDLSPMHMPASLGQKIYAFPELNYSTFKSLPGFVADSLPDDFGNSILDAWMARNGRTKPITPLERLQFTGSRGMGALEFRPANTVFKHDSPSDIELESLIRVAQDVLANRMNTSVLLDGSDDEQAMKTLLAVGTSAGGARPKAVLAFNDDFSRVLSGQVDVPEGFTHYLMKFDGIDKKHHKDFGNSLGYSATEYCYYQMAVNSGILMEKCLLLDEGHRRHFLTKRFDRDGNKKIHVQTLTGIAHVDYNKPGIYSYEQLFDIARQLRLPREDAEQLFKRMAFNVIAENNDDHSKNFAFIYENNRWRLSPAYDMAFAYNPESDWVGQHWMSVNGKRSDITIDDLMSVGTNVTRLGHSFLKESIEQVIDSVNMWPSLAKEQDVPKHLRDFMDPRIDMSKFSKPRVHIDIHEPDIDF